MTKTVGSLAAAGALLFAALPVRAQEGVRLRVEYDVLTTLVGYGPVGPVHWTINATLTAGNRVVETFDGRARGGGRSGGAEGKLGGRWRVAGANDLVRIIDYPNSRLVMNVHVSGRSCQAMLRAELKPGRSVFLLPRVSTGAFAEFSEARYENVVCSIE